MDQRVIVGNQPGWNRWVQKSFSAGESFDVSDKG